MKLQTLEEIALWTAVYAATIESLPESWNERSRKKRACMEADEAVEELRKRVGEGGDA